MPSTVHPVAPVVHRDAFGHGDESRPHLTQRDDKVTRRVPRSVLEAAARESAQAEIAPGTNRLGV
jgi:hypothetical protein